MNESRRKGRGGVSTSGIFLIVLGVLLLLDQMDIMDFGEVISTFWPLIIIYFGLKMILRSGDRVDVVEQLEEEIPDQLVEEDDVEHLQVARVFGDVRRRITSKIFAGGRCSVTFGDIDLDISDIKLAPGQRTLFVTTVFGDIRMRLPQNLPLLVRGNCTAGDITVLDLHSSGLFVNRSHKSQDFDTASDRLIIAASVVFGDIKIW